MNVIEKKLKYFNINNKSQSLPEKFSSTNKPIINLININKEEENLQNINYLKTTHSDSSTQNLLETQTLDTFKGSNFNHGKGLKIKSKYNLIVSIVFMSFSLLFMKVLFITHYERYRMRHSDDILNFFCGCYLFIFSIIFMKVDNVDLTNKKNFNKIEIDYLLIRSFLGFLSIYFTIKAVNNMRLVSSTTLIYLSPIICTFLLLKKHREKFKQSDKICLLASILIILIFIQQNFELEDSIQHSDCLKGILYSIIAAFLNSINSFIDKKICGEFHSYTILFTTGIFSIILTPIFLSFSNEKFYMSTRNFILFFIFGVSSFFGFYFNHKMIESNSLLVNSNLHSVTIGLSYIYSYFIFDEPFTILDIFASLILILLNFLMKLRAEEFENCDNIENL